MDAYIASLNGEYDGLYNKSGRAYPDIAALGQIFAVVWNGNVVRVDGTSAATPAAAGVLTLVNDALIAAGKPPLGFMNPWLYAYGYKAFTGEPLQTTCIDGHCTDISRCYERFFCRMQHHGLPCQGRLGRSDGMGNSSKHY